MCKKEVEIRNDGQPSFLKFKSYSVDEILAVGGTIASTGKKNGKNAASIIYT